jgi:hypothetical protein
MNASLVRASYFDIDEKQIREVAAFLKERMNAQQYNVSLTPENIVPGGSKRSKKDQWASKKLL